MGSASSVSNKTAGHTDDVNALAILEQEILHLQKATRNVNALDGYVDRVHENGEEVDSGSTSSRKSSSRRQHDTVVDQAERSVQGVCSYAGKIDNGLENLSHVLAQFREAAIGRCKTRFSGQKQNVATSSVDKQISLLDTMIGKTRKRLKTLESENPTPRVTASLRKDIQDFEKLKDTLESKQDMTSSSRQMANGKINPSEDDMIVDIIKWREEALHLKQRYEQLVASRTEAMSSRSEKSENLQTNNQTLLELLETSRHECSVAEYKMTDAVEKLQKIEEKLLEERMSHEVEVNSLKAMLEKQHKMITLEREGSKLLLQDKGKSNGSAPDETELKNKQPTQLNGESNVAELKSMPQKANDNSKVAQPKDQKQKPNSAQKTSNRSMFDYDQLLDNVKQNGKQKKANKVHKNTKDNGKTTSPPKVSTLVSNDRPIPDEQHRYRNDDTNKLPPEAVAIESPTEYRPETATEHTERIIDGRDSNKRAFVDEPQPRTESKPDNVFLTSMANNEQDCNDIEAENNDNDMHDGDSIRESEKSKSDSPVSVHSTKEECNEPSEVVNDNAMHEDMEGHLQHSASPQAIETPKEDTTPNTTKQQSNVNNQATREEPDFQESSQSANAEETISMTEYGLTHHKNIKDTPMITSKDEAEEEPVEDPTRKILARTAEASDLKPVNNETPEKDVVLYKQGMTKEIIYRRSDGYIDGNLSYHKGIGAIVRTAHPALEVDTLQVDIIDELETEMLPDLVDGERVISFHVHVQQQYGTKLVLTDEAVKLYIPHRQLEEYEDASLISSVSGGDWEPCDLVTEKPASLGMGVSILGTELLDVADVKCVAIARERTASLIAGESDVRYQAMTDKSVTVHINKGVFKSRTEVKLLVHHSHDREMISAIEIHPECQNIMSCTAFVALTCEHVTRGEITLTIELSEFSSECKYTMFCLWDTEWKLVDCDWKEEERMLFVHLPTGSKKYRVLGVELPTVMSMEDRLLAVKTLHEHVSHYIVRLLFRQREDDPSQAVVICFRSNLVKNGIFELTQMGYSIGSYPSAQFCLQDRDKLTLHVTGDVSATPVNSDRMEMTFLSQKEIATKELYLEPNVLPEESPRKLKMVQGNITITMATRGEEPIIVLSETIHLPVQKSEQHK